MFGSYTGRDTETALLALRELLDEVPSNPLRDLRGDLHQEQLAAKSGYRQAAISDMERGRRNIGPEASRKLGKALGLHEDSLLVAGRLAALKEQLAQDQEPTAEELLQLTLFLEDKLPESEFKEELRALLVGAMEGAIARFKEEKQVATKSKKRTRDAHGRRIDDPLGLGLKSRRGEGDGRERGENGRVKRDASGRRIDKPMDPTRAGRRSA